MFFSFIIPVFNRPQEIDELLHSILNLDFEEAFEVVIIEDGSTEKCENIVLKYANELTIKYLFKPNTGPGHSRNYGMLRAKGDYFIILDSDCLLPKEYLLQVKKGLTLNFTDCFGGPDAALASFSSIQKAINFSMTSFLTTGGIRGGNENLSKFQPRSFNMGISKEAFLLSKGFGNIHPGEDPDLTIRLWNLGFKTQLISEAFVFHKRRIDWNKFYTQVNKFGKTRPILNLWYPKYAKITYWFPTFFSLGLFTAVALAIVQQFLLISCYVVYFIILFLTALFETKQLKVAVLSCVATLIQFTGYGLGFLISNFKIFILKRMPELAFPKLFFKND